MGTSSLYVDSGSTVALATNDIAEDAITKQLSRSVLNNSAGTEVAIAASPIFASITSEIGIVATVTSMNTLAYVTSLGTIASVTSMGGLAGIGVLATINSVATHNVETVASITSINSLASITSVYGIKTIASITSMTALGTVGTVASITSMDTLATVTSIGALVSLTSAGGIGGMGTLATVTSMNTLAFVTSVGSLGSLQKTFLNKCIDYSAAAETALVAAIAGKRIKVYAYSVIGASTATNIISFKDDTSGTVMWKIPFSSIYGANLAVTPPSFLFASASGGTLAMAASVATSVTVSISYWEEA